MDRGRGSGPDPSAGIEFVMQLGAALHRFGTPAHRLEATMSAVARQLELDAQILSTPTYVMAGFGPLTDQRHVLIRIDPGEVNLDKLAALDRVATLVGRGRLDVSEGAARVRTIAEGPGYPAPALALAFAGLSAAVCGFLSGSWYDVAAAAVIGLVIGLIAVVLGRWIGGNRLFEVVAAFAASAMAHGAVALGAPIALHIVILAGLIALLPGLTLTVAMTEVATRNLVSGTARLTAAAMTFLEITFGVALAEVLMTRLVGAPMIDAAPAMPEWTRPVALAVFVPSAMVALGAHWRALPVIAVIGAAALYSSRFGSLLLTPELGAALGSFVIGASSNIYARWTDRSAMVPMAPGLLLLVPGSLGLRSLSSFIERDAVSGLDTAFAMILVTVSLVAGLLIANATVPPRREL